MTQESWFRRIWRLITPELIYLALCYLIDIAAAGYWAFSMAGDYSQSNMDAFVTALSDKLIKYAMVLQSAAAFFSILILLRMYFKDYKKRRFVFDRKGTAPGWWLILIPIGVFVSLAGNLLINVSDLAAMSEGFEQSQQMLFSGPLVAQIIGIGVIIPICEELIYRGLIFMRLRQYCNVNLAIGISALLFAAFHGNIVQGIYAFVTGILFAYVYEKYGSLKAPMIVHISANLMSLGLAWLNYTFESRMKVLVVGVIAAVICLAFVWVMDRHVSAKRIYLNQAEASEA